MRCKAETTFGCGMVGCLLVSAVEVSAAEVPARRPHDYRGQGVHVAENLFGVPNISSQFQPALFLSAL